MYLCMYVHRSAKNNNLNAYEIVMSKSAFKLY